jgi:ElaB/YqjD/DUF883 family membrane-anchored ribosome-binding protein
MYSESTAGQDVRQKAEETASTLVDQAQQVAQTTATTQKERAAETLGALAQTLRESGSSMREQQPQIASIADQAAQRVEGISTYVRDHDVSELVGEAERFARREPLIFVGGAFALGFLASRFIKAAMPQGQAGGGQQTLRSRDYSTGYGGNMNSYGTSYGTGYGSEYGSDYGVQAGAAGASAGAVGGDYTAGATDYTAGATDYTAGGSGLGDTSDVREYAVGAFVGSQGSELETDGTTTITSGEDTGDTGQSGSWSRDDTADR